MSINENSQSAVTAERYARWRDTVLGRLAEAAELEVVFELVGSLEGKRVLDVGTGDGAYGIEAAVRGASVIGLDIDQSMLDAAAMRAASRGVELRVQKGSAEQLPFDGGCFDVVLAITVLCFVPNAERAVAEMSRVLAPGGRLVIGELGRFSVWAARRRIRGWLGDALWREARFWSHKDLVKLVKVAGLQVQDIRGSVHFPPSAIAAQLITPLEPLLSRLRVPGAAFLAIAADRR